jgi:hypothetical protein
MKEKAAPAELLNEREQEIETTFLATWAQGRELTLEQAVAQALEE